MYSEFRLVCEKKNLSCEKNDEHEKCQNGLRVRGLDAIHLHRHITKRLKELKNDKSHQCPVSGYHIDCKRYTKHTRQNV